LRLQFFEAERWFIFKLTELSLKQLRVLTNACLLKPELLSEAHDEGRKFSKITKSRKLMRTTEVSTRQTKKEEEILRDEMQ